MREFKFRVYDLEEDVFVDVNSVLESSVNDLNNSRFRCQQWTGMRDIKGNEIYEGDIVMASESDKKHRIQEIVFTDGAFCGYSDKKFCKHTFLEVLIKAYDIEIIGNIYKL
jgi:hypothetical protein